MRSERLVGWGLIILDPPPSRHYWDIRWRQYDRLITLYREYLDLVLRLNMFFYAITGALVSYTLKDSSGDDVARWALWLPILMAVALAVVFVYGACLPPMLRLHVFRLRDELALGVAPDLGMLTWLLILFAALFFIVAVGLAFLFSYQPFHAPHATPHP